MEAMTDALTGLYNRRGWDHLLVREEARCASYGSPACVMAVDLDGLKAINDRLGHSAGDALIQTAGQVLRQTVRPQDVVARVGGDEFAILCVDCTTAEVGRLYRRLQLALANQQVQASLGCARRHPSRGLIQAWAKADGAMYAHKRAVRTIQKSSLINSPS